MKSSPKKTDPATVPLSSIHLNDGKHGLPKNPRFIRDERFAALCASIRDNPEYMPARPIIVNEDGCILGGNMRFRACKANGMTHVPASWIQRVVGWSIEKQKRFIIMDNRGFGEDDMDALANEWDVEDLIAAGFTEEELTGAVTPECGEAAEKAIHNQWLIMVPCRDEMHQTELLDKFLSEGIECKALQS